MWTGYDSRMRLIVGLALAAACGKSKPSDPPPPETTSTPAAPTKPENKADDPCKMAGFVDLSKLGMKLQIEAPALELRDILNVSPGAELVKQTPDDRVMYSLQIRPATDEDAFEKVKAEIDSRVEKYKAKITWGKSATTADGYRLEYSELGAAKGATPGYSIVHVRTIGGQKYWCSNDSSVEATTACAIRSCDSLKPL